MFDHSTCGDWNTSLVEEETLSECLKGQERWNISKPLRKGPLWGFTFLNALSFCVLTSLAKGDKKLLVHCSFPKVPGFIFNQYLGWWSQLPHNLKRWMPSCTLAYSIPYHINEVYIYIHIYIYIYISITNEWWMHNMYFIHFIQYPSGSHRFHHGSTATSLPMARPEDVARKTVAAQKEAANSRQRPKGVAALRQKSVGGTGEIAWGKNDG